MILEPAVCREKTRSARYSQLRAPATAGHPIANLKGERPRPRALGSWGLSSHRVRRITIRAAIAVVAILLGACASTRLEHDPRSAVHLTATVDPVVLPEAKSATTCLTDAAANNAWLAGQAYLHLLDAAELSEACWTGFVNPQRMTGHTDGIYLIERYDPDRIPVLVIQLVGTSGMSFARSPITATICATPVTIPEASLH